MTDTGATACYRMVVFDFDGVLCDSADLAVETFSRLREQHFPDAPAVRTRQDLGRVCDGPSDTWLTAELGAPRAREFWGQHERMQSAAWRRLALFPLARHLLAALPDGTASIVTGGNASRVRAVLRAAFGRIPPSVDAVLGREQPGGKAQKIRGLLAAARYTPQDAILVGDTVSDVLAAYEVGMGVAAISTGYQAADQLATSAPTYLFQRQDELLALLGKHFDIP